MEIPTPYIFKIETPTLLFEEHLFQPGNETTRNTDYLEIRGKRFGLEEIAAPKVLEDLYFDNNKELFEQYKRDFVSTSMHQIYLSAEHIESELRNNRTLSLIVNEILPVITAVKIDNQVEAALNDKTYTAKEDMKDIFSNISRAQGRVSASGNSELVSKTKDELIRNVETEYAHIGTKKSRRSSIDDYISRELMSSVTGGVADARRPSPQEPSILNDELLAGANLLFIENRMYELYTIPKLMLEYKDRISSRYWEEISQTSPSTDPAIIVDSVRRNYNQIDPSAVSRIINKLRSTRLNIDGNFFFPLYLNEVADTISDYKKLVEKRLKIDSINHASFQAESLRKIEEEKSRLSRLVNANRLEINGAGFEYTNGSYYVFITTPKYALRSPHNGSYYQFDRAKIGVEIMIRGDTVEIKEPVVINSYRHPFLPGSSTYQRICLGRYSTSSARRLPPGQAVLTILTKAQENLMMGYRTGSNPHNRLDDDRFQSYKMSKQAFDKSGLVCLNDYRDRG